MIRQQISSFSLEKDKLIQYYKAYLTKRIKQIMRSKNSSLLQFEVIIILVQLIHMAALIEGRLLPDISEKQQKNMSQETICIIEELAKSLSENSGIVQRKNDQLSSEIFVLFSFEKQQFIIELSATQECKKLIIFMREIKNGCYNRLNSKHMGIWRMKDIAKIQHYIRSQPTFIINKSCTIMALKLYFAGNINNKKYLIEFYKQIILKSFHQFQKYLKCSFNITQTKCIQLQKLTQFQQSLYLAQTYSTIDANFDVHQDQSNYLLVNETTQTRNAKVKQAQQAIVLDGIIQRINDLLFQYVKNQHKSSEISVNFKSAFDKLRATGKKYIAPLKSGNKKISDFLFNIVRVEVKECQVNFFSSGGSSQVFRAQVQLTYLNSVDFTSYKKKDEKQPKRIAIKKLKQKYKQMYKHKLLHQKLIVSKLKGSCNHFLPKYYGTQKDSEFNNALLMELIQPGIDFRNYIQNRSQIISFWSKICILINAVQGIRHLVNYGIVHFDLKPENIIVCNKSLAAKIIDYGQAYHKEVCHQDYAPGYTFPYVAPEIYGRIEDKVEKRTLSQLKINQKHDVFAFGMIMHEILFEHRNITISDEKIKQVYYRREIYDKIFAIPQSYKYYGTDPIMSTVLSIIIRCMHPEPQSRPKFDWIGLSLQLILNSYVH